MSALAEPFYLRYRGGSTTLVGDSEPTILTGVALVRGGPSSRPQIVLIQERPVGTKGKMEHLHKIVATNGLEAPPCADGTLLLRSQQPVHLKLLAKLVDAVDGQAALDAFASRLTSALASGRLDAAAPTAESVLAAVHSVPLAKKARTSLGGGYRPGSNLGKASSNLATGQRHVPVLPIWGGTAFRHGSARSSRMFDAAMGADQPKRPEPYQLPAPAPHKPPPSWPPPEAPRKQTPTHHQHQPPPLIRQQLLHQPASSSSGTRALPRLQPAPSSGGGFKNLGNTCYINATLSALLAIRPFVRDLTSPSLSDRLMPHLPSVSVFRALFGLAHEHESGGTATPRQLKQAIAQRCSQFAGHEQQDAHEFLSDCLDLLHDELAGAAKADAADEVTPPLANGAPAVAITEDALPTALNFLCTVHHELTCLQCGKQWTRPEAMRDFSLELPAAAAAGRELPTIQTLLRTFFASEELEVGCEQCGHPRAKVEHRIAQLPRVLVLQLKRFEFGQAGVRKRLDAVRPVPSLSLGFCCTEHTKPPPRVDATSLAPTAAPAVAAAARRISETDPATVRKKINFGQDEARDHEVPHCRTAGSPTRPTWPAAQPGSSRGSSTAATGGGGGGGGGSKQPALTQTTLGGDSRPSSKQEWKARRQQEEDEFARAIAASLADEQGGTAPAEMPTSGEVVELDGLEEGDDEEAQVRRALEASLRDGERAASRLSAATAPLPATTRATPPDTPAGMPPIAPSATPSAAPITATAPPGAPPSAPHEQINLTDDGSADAAARYSLCGVVWHTGSSAGAGHYVADVRQQLDRPAEWKRYNDAVVTTVPRDTVLQQEALSKGYIFFYVHSDAE